MRISKISFQDNKNMKDQYTELLNATPQKQFQDNHENITFHSKKDANEKTLGLINEDEESI